MKKTLNLVIMAVLLLQLSGCTGSSNTDKITSDETQDTKKTISESLAGDSDSSKPDTASIDPANNQKPDSGSKKTVDTSKPNQPSNTLRFIVMADSRGLDKGINTKIVRTTMERIKKLSPQPEFAIMPGDLVDGAKSFKAVKTQLEYFKKVITEYYPVSFFYPGLGNHEIMHNSGGEKAFDEVFSEFDANSLEGYGRTVYYFDWGNSRFFMLNTDYPGERHIISDKQMNWVKSNLDSSKEHTFFFMHEPPYPTGSGIGSSLDANRLQRNKLWQLIDSSVSPMVFCGHEHYYTRRHINSDFNDSVNGVDFIFHKNIFQVTVGSFGAPLYDKYASKKNVDVPPTSQYHYAVVDVTNEETKVTVYNLEGKIIDEFTEEMPYTYINPSEVEWITKRGGLPNRGWKVLLAGKNDYTIKKIVGLVNQGGNKTQSTEEESRAVNSTIRPVGLEIKLSGGGFVYIWPSYEITSRDNGWSASPRKDRFILNIVQGEKDEYYTIFSNDVYQYLSEDSKTDIPAIN